MKKRWKYLVGALLLTTALLSGCSAEAVLPQEPVQVAETRETDVPEVKVQEEAEVSKAAESENPETEAQTEAEADSLEAEMQTEAGADSPETDILEDRTYTSREEVAEYLHIYGHLPDNFITKKEAKALGWVSSEGNLAEVAPGKSIGGDYFGNFEGNLPEKDGREYHECDIDSDGGYRGAKRLVYSNDGLIYYTEDHYETFELLYGEE